MLKERKKTQIVAVRVRAEERDLLDRAAVREGKQISEWVRDVLLSAAEKRGPRR
jgi:uncharacterized protein (DUF1778 family)